MNLDCFSKGNRVKAASFAATAFLFIGVGSARAATDIPVESFSGDVTVSENWVAGGTGAGACLTASKKTDATPVPGCSRPAEDELGSGVLRLTNAEWDQSGYMLYNSPIPSADGLDALFYASQWGGSGADGIAFFFTKGSADLTQPGGNGGSLGYAAKYAGSSDQQPGVDRGLLGIGFDVYGAFGEDTSDGTDCADSAPGGFSNSVAIRGPGNGYSGYCFIDIVDLTPLGVVLHGDTREAGAHLFRIRVDGSDVTDRMVTVYIDGVEVISVPLPQEFIDTEYVKFGWTAGTGADTDYHEVWGATVVTATQPEDFEYEAPTLQDDKEALAPTTTVEVLANTGTSTDSLQLIAAGLVFAGAICLIQLRRRPL